MKWSTSITAVVASTAAMVSASPLASRANLIRTYKLKVVAPTAAGLNGRYLSIQSDGSVGVYTTRNVDAGGLVPPSAPPHQAEAPAPPAPARFYVTTAGTTGDDAHRYELHSYPVGIVDHALALNGSASLLYLNDVASPTTAKINGPRGYKLDWKSFTLGGFDGGGDDDHAVVEARVPPPLLANGLSYAGSHGRWVLIQRAANTFAAAWYDGTSIILDNYRPVDIAYEE